MSRMKSALWDQLLERQQQGDLEDEGPSRIEQRTPAGWNINLNSFGIYEASHDDFDASYEGPEDGWVGNGLATTGNSLDEVLCGIQEIEEEHPHFEEQRREASK